MNINKRIDEDEYIYYKTKMMKLMYMNKDYALQEIVGK